MQLVGFVACLHTRIGLLHHPGVVWWHGLETQYCASPWLNVWVMESLCLCQIYMDCSPVKRDAMADVSHWRNVNGGGMSHASLQGVVRGRAG